MPRFEIEKLWQGNRLERSSTLTLPDIKVRIVINGKTYESKVHSNIVGAIHELKQMVREDYSSAFWMMEKDIEYIKIPKKNFYLRVIYGG